MPRIWLDYCQFLMAQQKVTQTRRTFDRALQALPLTQHGRIWPLYIQFVRSHDLPETAIRVYRRYLKVQSSQLITIQWEKVSDTRRLCIASVMRNAVFVCSCVQSTLRTTLSTSSPLVDWMRRQ